MNFFMVVFLSCFLHQMSYASNQLFSEKAMQTDIESAITAYVTLQQQEQQKRRDEKRKEVESFGHVYHGLESELR